MNTQLVNSLVQIIESLTPEERTLLFERLSSKSIQVTAGVCGGQPRIRNTRIPGHWLLSVSRGQTTRNYCETIPPSASVTYPLPGHTTNSTTKKAIALLLPLMRMGMVKLYSNENFPMDIVMQLRRLGYDVLTSYDAGQANQGIPHICPFSITLKYLTLKALLGKGYKAFSSIELASHN